MKISSEDVRRRLLPIALSQVTGLACGLAGVKISTRFVAPAHYGAFGIFLSLAPLGMWVVHAGLIKFLNRHWASSSNRAGLWREVVAAGIRKLPWLAAATAAGAAFAPGQSGIATWLLLFGTASLLSVGALTQAGLQAIRSHWTDFAVSTVASISRTFVPPFIYVAVAASLVSLETGFLIHTALFALVGLLCFRGWAGKDSSGERQLTSVYEGSLFVVLSAAGWMALGMNRWIVASFYGASAAGYFTLASNVALIVTSMLGVIVAQYFQPDFFSAPSADHTARRHLAARVDRVAGGYWLVSLAGVLLLHRVAPLLTGWLISERYSPALAMIGPAGCFGAAITTGQFYHTLLLAGRRERACGPVDIGTMFVLAVGGVAAAAGSERIFLTWLCISPLVPWAVTRPLTRYFLFKPAAADGPALAP